MKITKQWHFVWHLEIQLVAQGFIFRCKTTTIAIILISVKEWFVCQHRPLFSWIVWFQKLSIPPPWKGFFLRSPHLSGNSSQASYIYLNFGAFENPPSPGISNPFVGGVWTFSGTTHWRKMLLLAGNRLVSFIKRANTLEPLLDWSTPFYMVPPPPPLEARKRWRGWGGFAAWHTHTVSFLNK